jgi:hypothetical protein
MDQIVAVMRGAAAAVDNDGLSPDGLTGVIKTAFSKRNRFDAAVTGAVGAPDRIVETAPGGELTGGLPSVKYGYHLPWVLGSKTEIDGAGPAGTSANSES